MRRPGTTNANRLAPYARSSLLLLRTVGRLFRQASSEWIDDNAPRLGASIAFYALLSLAPVIVLAVAAAAVLYGEEAAQGRLAAEFQGMAGPDLARTVQEIVRGAQQSQTGVIATLFSLATLAFGASSTFVELRDAMNTIWHISLPPDRSRAATVIRLIQDRFYAFATVLGAGILLVVSLALNAWVSAMQISVPRAAMFMVSSLVIAALFAALYKVVPDVRLKWSDVALGAIVTSLLFMLGKQFMGLYFTHASVGSTYGAAAAPIVALLWVYYSAQLFFWGAEFSKAYTKTLGSQSNRQH